MWFKQHRLQALVLFIVSLVFILLLATSFWNHMGGWSLVFLLLSLITVSLFYIIFRKATDPGSIENLISEKVSDERKRILSEMDKKDEVKEDKGIEIEKKVADILPKGNFKSAESFAKKLLSNLASDMQMVMGILYTAKNKNNSYTFLAGYALPSEQIPADFKSGENLNGQAASSKEIMVLRNLPEEYFAVESGLGKSKPRNLIIAPLVNNNKTIAIVEIATFIEIDTNIELIVQKICSLAAEKLAEL